jgi:hypothetical protein
MKKNYIKCENTRIFKKDEDGGIDEAEGLELVSFQFVQL